MALVSKNPATEEVMATFEEEAPDAVAQKIACAHEAFLQWRSFSFSDRARYMRALAGLLRQRARRYGEVISCEMGKPIAQATAEVEKCAWVCEYYAEHAEQFLSPEEVATDASKSYVRFDPEGVILAVMPWNFPFWQVFRAAAPALMAGNTMVLKHASNVPQAGQEIEQAFRDAGFPEGVFANVLVGSAQVENMIQHSAIRAVTLTGSEYAGSQVAMHAGRAIKKTVLELGGSDPFVVFSDADLDLCCTTAFVARFQNAGQSCIAAKRFIIVQDIFDAFVERFTEEVKQKRVGDPLQEDTDIGPLATESILQDAVRQAEESLARGARVVVGGRRREGRGYFFEPTIMTDVTPSMAVFSEETFAPIAACISVADEKEAIAMANQSSFGLGASLWTQDIEKAERYAQDIDAGAVFINGMVKSDPRLPFGGVKKSGYGRELSSYGIKEFVNIKTVWVR